VLRRCANSAIDGSTGSGSPSNRERAQLKAVNAAFDGESFVADGCCLLARWDRYRSGGPTACYIGALLEQNHIRPKGASSRIDDSPKCHSSGTYIEPNLLKLQIIVRGRRDRFPRDIMEEGNQICKLESPYLRHKHVAWQTKVSTMQRSWTFGGLRVGSSLICIAHWACVCPTMIPPRNPNPLRRPRWSVHETAAMT
jgi:hypothetical protein